MLILVLGAQRTRIASEPQRLVAGRPGFLLAYIDGSADVWRVREGKIRSWQRFADVGEASRAAGVVTG